MYILGGCNKLAFSKMHPAHFRSSAIFQLKKVVFLILFLLTLAKYNSAVAMSMRRNHDNQIKTTYGQTSQNTAKSEIFPSFCLLNDETCCEKAYSNIKENWKHGKLPLTQFLENLRRANCTRFAYECKRRTLAYTKFTSLVYSRFCEYEIFRNDCKNGKCSVPELFDAYSRVFYILLVLSKS